MPNKAIPEPLGSTDERMCYNDQLSGFDYFLISALETNVAKQYIKMVLLQLRAHQGRKATGWKEQHLSPEVRLGSWPLFVSMTPAMLQ